MALHCGAVYILYYLSSFDRVARVSVKEKSDAGRWIYS